MEQLSGTTQFLTIKNIEGSTYYLESEDKQEVRMNKSVVKEDLEVGEEISVFIYPNTRGELFATPVIPDISVDKFGFAEVTKIDYDGAFLDIGAPREILIPWVDLPKVREVWPKPGDKVYVKLRREGDNQLFGKLIQESEVAERFTPIVEKHYEEIKNTWIEGVPYRLLRVGTFLLTDDGHKVFIHESERQKEPRLGERVKFRVIGMNEQGEINGSFRQKAYRARDEDSEKILNYIKQNGGMMPLTDKSTPEDITDAFSISKGAFKRAMGKLMKEGLIIQEDGQTVLKEDKSNAE